jgi:hypothetical protein
LLLRVFWDSARLTIVPMIKQELFIKAVSISGIRGVLNRVGYVSCC